MSVAGGGAFDGETAIVYNIRKNNTHKRSLDGGDKIGT